jgi:hypothetical protein
MTSISRIAILTHSDIAYSVSLDEILAVLAKKNIEAQIFTESDSIIKYKPDLVIVTSPQHAKTTPFPTYGLINRPRGSYLAMPRFLRNIMTYDGYFTISPRLNMMLRDIMFGARKLSTSILKFDLYPSTTNYNEPTLMNSGSRIIIFDRDIPASKLHPAITHLVDSMSNVDVVSFNIPIEVKHRERYKIVSNHQELDHILRQYPIAICLNSGDNQEEIINSSVMKLIASGSVVIAHQTKLLEEYFGSNLYYVSKDTDMYSLPAVVNNHLKNIFDNKEDALAKAHNSYKIFAENFALDTQLIKLQDFHNQTLINKGYVPNPDAAIEAALPSVTYIMRTGGKHRAFLERTLDCLIAQQYPDLRVLFVIHARFDYINEIIAQYPSLKIKVIESIKSRRSEAIRDGMAAIETDLFGLFDDDDELFPNHVRSLVKTLQYHTNRDWRGQIGMVYSGSVHADDTHLVEERVEFRDHLLEKSCEKRAIEHFRFYSSVMMSAHSWFMPNGWLARTSLIDSELLVDPELDTCEDLYFELQIAQKAHMAFSAEVTAVHNFHHLGNSTIDDSYKHLPDTQRIALRNFMRVFPTDSLYDTQYNVVGRLADHDPNQLAYQEHRPITTSYEYYENQFYPFRTANKTGLVNDIAHKKLNWLALIFKPLTSLKTFNKYKNLTFTERAYYINKYKLWMKQHGFFSAVKKTIFFLLDFNRGAHASDELLNEVTAATPMDSYYKFRVKLRYEGLWNALKTFKGGVKKSN